MEFINNKPEGGVENIDSYEREKILRTLGDVELLQSTIKAYLQMIDYCDEHGIKMEHKVSLEKIRYPDSEVEAISSILSKFQAAQTEAAKNMTKEQCAEAWGVELR